MLKKVKTLRIIVILMIIIIINKAGVHLQEDLGRVRSRRTGLLKPCYV